MKILFACLSVLISVSGWSQKDRPYVVMVSFDGFRFDYVEKYNLPYFKKFIQEGAAADGLIPSFPSKTFPNHYTLVTGLYPGNHGLVDNKFYDRQLDKSYEIRNREMVEDPVFYGGTPLWQLAQKQGVPAASFFWVGSEAPVGGSFPDYYYRYDDAVPNESRIQKIIDWLNLPEEKRPHFISLYFSLVDTEGHNSGPNSESLNKTVLQADSLLGMLIQKTEETKLPVNIILVSDHGMYEIKQDSSSFIILGKFLNLKNKSLRIANGGTQAHLYTNNPDSLYQVLKKIEKKFRFTVYQRESFPEEWHYQHDRTGDLLLCADPGTYIAITSNNLWRSGAHLYFGVHGYDPDKVPEMKGIFYAKGPNIKKGIRIPAFKNIHVYPFVAKILWLEIPEIDGDASVLAPLFRE